MPLLLDHWVYSTNYYAQVILAEAEIPKAMAEAFRSGNLGIMDYTNYKNLIADTKMRESIAGEGGETSGEDPSV